MNLRRPKCPYCGKKVDYLIAWRLRRRGEYFCSRCRGVSNIKMDTITPFLAFAAVITTLILFLIIRVLLKITTIKSIFWILLPIFLFYLLSVFLVRLKRPIIKKVPKKKSNNTKSNNYRNNSSNYRSSSSNYSSRNNVSNDWNSKNNMNDTKIL